MGLMTQSAGKLTKIKIVAVTCAVAAAVGTIFDYDIIGISGQVTPSMAPLARVDRNPVELRTWCAAVVVVAICVYATGLAWSGLLAAEIVPLKMIRSAGWSVYVWVNIILSQCFLTMLGVVKYALFIFFSIFVFLVKIYFYFVFGLIIFFFSFLFLGYYLLMT